WLGERGKGGANEAEEFASEVGGL
ncbi:hypothetical protein Q654_01449, partial [Bartonella henselae JK 50]